MLCAKVENTFYQLTRSGTGLSRIACLAWHYDDNVPMCKSSRISAPKRSHAAQRYKHALISLKNHMPKRNQHRRCLLRTIIHPTTWVRTAQSNKDQGNAKTFKLISKNLQTISNLWRKHSRRLRQVRPESKPKPELPDIRTAMHATRQHHTTPPSKTTFLLPSALMQGQVFE